MSATALVDVPAAQAPVGGHFLVGACDSGAVFTPEDFTEAQRQALATTKRFVEAEVVPRIAEFERKEPGLARQLIEQSAELGLLAILVPERHDGLELDITTQMLVAEAMGGYASFSTTYGAHAGIGTLPLVFFGTEEQRQRYLPRMVTGELLAAYCLSEPQAGSDSQNSLTRAELSSDGKHYVLNGQKMWISNGGWADLYTVFAKVDGEDFTAFLVEREYEGVKPGAEEHKMGLRGSSTTALYLDNVHVPVENVLGEVGRGHVIAFNVLNMGRLELAAACVGGAKDSISDSASYALQRKAFGQPIANFGAIRQKLADMAVRVFASESMVYRTSGMIDARLADVSWDSPEAARQTLKAVEEYAIECSIAKVYVSEVLDFTTDEAVQIHGGYGYHEDYAVERNYRDSRINRIFEGTNEINRLLTTGMLLKRAGQGRLDLLTAVAQAAGDPADSATPVDKFAGLAAQQDIVDRMRKATLRMAGLAYRRFGDSLDRQQEVAAAVGDMAAAVYASESALLRTAKLASDRRGGNARDMLTVLLQRSLGTVQELGGLVIGACSDGVELENTWSAFQRLTGPAPSDLPAARDRIAARILESGGYSV